MYSCVEALRSRTQACLQTLDTNHAQLNCRNRPRGKGLELLGDRSLSETKTSAETWSESLGSESFLAQVAFQSHFPAIDFCVHPEAELDTESYPKSSASPCTSSSISSSSSSSIRSSNESYSASDYHLSFWEKLHSNIFVIGALWENSCDLSASLNACKY